MLMNVRKKKTTENAGSSKWFWTCWSTNGTKKIRFNFFSGSSYSTGSCQLHNMWKKRQFITQSMKIVHFVFINIKMCSFSHTLSLFIYKYSP